LEAEAKQFATDPDRSGIYVNQVGGVGSALIFFTTLDDVNIGPLAPNTYQKISVTPGRHTATLIGKANQETVTIDALAGENYAG